MNNGNDTTQKPRIGGKVKYVGNAVLAGALASALGFTASYADHHGGHFPALEMAAQKSTISSKTEEGAGTKLKFWFEDSAGNMTSADETYLINVSSTNADLIADFSFTLAKGTRSTVWEIGGAGSPDVSVGSGAEGSTTLLAVATATGSTTSLKSHEVPLKVVDKYLKASFTDFSKDANIGRFLNITLTDNSDEPVTAPAKVAHYTGGIGSAPLEVVAPESFPFNVNTDGNLRLRFAEPTGTVTTPSDEYYLISSDGIGDAIIAGDTVADVIIPPNLVPMEAQPNVFGGVSKQDGNFSTLFPAEQPTTFSINDQLNAVMSIKPEQAHVGKKAAKIIVYGYSDIFQVLGLDPTTILTWTAPTEDATNNAYRFPPLAWDWQTNTPPLTPYQSSKILAEEEAFHLFSGSMAEIGGLTGIFYFFAGYQLIEDGTQVYNLVPNIGRFIVQ